MNPAPKDPSWRLLGSAGSVLLVTLGVEEAVGRGDGGMQLASSPARLLPAWGAGWSEAAAASASVSSLVTPRMSNSGAA